MIVFVRVIILDFAELYILYRTNLFVIYPVGAILNFLQVFNMVGYLFLYCF
jgi:hypothetical protein